MLSTIFSRPLASIRLALKVLSDFQMIEIAENNVIRIVNWERHQNVEGMDRVREQNRKRVQNHREKKKQLGAVAKKLKNIAVPKVKNIALKL
jgi:predicted phage replisome organizer